MWRQLQSTVYLSWVPGDLNPADPMSRIDSDWNGDWSVAEQAACDRFRALQAYNNLPTPVWVLGFPKGRKGAFRNMSSSVIGSA